MNLVLWVFINNNNIDIDVNISGENGDDVHIKDIIAKEQYEKSIYVSWNDCCIGR